VGFTASRKVGNAVARNRARRRLRAVSAVVLPAHARRGKDYVLIARSGTLTRRYQELIEDLEEGLKQLGVFRP
jgi:ribonuclease P protein component